MTDKTSLFQRCRFLGIGGILILAIWLATAIASPAQTLTTLTNFDETNGYDPEAALVQGTDGNFYGTTFEGGANSQVCWGYRCGTAFRITHAGTLTTLHSFCESGGCGGDLVSAGLVLGTNGNFYGAAAGGGAGYGTIFEIAPAGRLTELHSFDGSDGWSPSAALVQAIDGNFYGTTYYGGANGSGCGGIGCGTVFRVSSTGTLTTLHSFCTTPGCPDGFGPWYAGLVQATDGNFYGTTYYGGANGSDCGGNGCGTVFRITPTGKLTTLHSFDGTDGANPQATLAQGADGNFYGVSARGGTNSLGTAFKITPSGNLTTLYTFCSQANCTDGDTPLSGLVQATDGNFYGTTQAGGANGDGTVFEITPSGTLTTLYSFCSQTGCADGSNPWAGLLQATNGTFYGTTQAGGANGDGTVFSLSTGLGPFVSFVRNAAKVGQNIIILGQGFTGTTGVSFNGTPATFIVKADTFLTATVPAGATTGPVTVTTPGGTLTSNVSFRVLP